MNRVSSTDIAGPCRHAREGTSVPDRRRTGTLTQEKAMLPADHQFLAAIAAAEFHQLEHDALA
jgi:hypothetical protein